MEKGLPELLGDREHGLRLEAIAKYTAVGAGNAMLLDLAHLLGMSIAIKLDEPYNAVQAKGLSFAPPVKQPHGLAIFICTELGGNS